MVELSVREAWTEKYRPKRLSEVVGNAKAIEELRAWADAVAAGVAADGRVKRAAILHGPPGCGKTSAAYALASDMGWEVIELNASDQRNESVIEKIVGHASSSTTFCGGTRLIILDEADNLHGNEDRGGSRAITEIVKKTSQPIILIANDLYRMSKALQRNCRLIRFYRLRPERIYRVLREICMREGIEAEEQVLRILAGNAKGDLRSAINDLQALSISASGTRVGGGKERIEEADIATGERDTEQNIFDVLRKIYTPRAGTDLQEVVSSLHSLDKTPEETISWIYDNLPSEQMRDTDLLHALHYLSRADTFLGRARARENFKFWRYASSLMACCGASASLASTTHYHRSNFRSPWQRGRVPHEGDSGSPSRRHEPIEEEIAQKISMHCKVSQSYARSYILPLLRFFFLNHQKAVAITQLLHLDIPQIAFLCPNRDTRMAKKVYQESITGREIGAGDRGGSESKTRAEEREMEGGSMSESGSESGKQRSLAEFLPSPE